MSLNRFTLGLTGLGLLALIAAAAVLLASQDSGDELTDPEPRPLGPGFVWLDGEWLSPPYYVETDASVIRINARIARRVSRSQTEDVAVSGQQAGPLGALMEAAAIRFDEMGGPVSSPPSDQALAELVGYVESQPGAAAVSFEAPVLSITDETGETGYVILQRPDPVTERQNIRTLQAVTTRWTESLRRGDALLFSDDVTIEVPANRALGFLRDLVAVFDLPQSEQLARMIDVVGSQALAQALLDSGPPPETLTRRLATLAPDKPDQEAAPPSLPSAQPVSLQQTAPYRTPGSNKVYIFQPIEVEGPDWCFPDALIEAALAHGYQVVHLRGRASTLDELVASSGRAGILYACGHWHAMEPAAGRDAAMAAVAGYRRSLGLGPQDAYPVVSISTRTAELTPIPQFYVATGSGFFQQLWRSSNSIVILLQCHSAGLASGLEARDLLVLDGQCFGVEAERDLESAFFSRFAGTAEGAAITPLADAFAAHLRVGGWVLLGDGNTVLSPGVVDYSPQGTVTRASASPINGRVHFDTPMDQATPGVLDNIVRVQGCGALLTGARWAGDSTLEFDFTTGQNPEADSSSILTITVDAAWAASADAALIKLDGNQDPPGTNHAGPNHDDFVWTLDCTG